MPGIRETIRKKGLLQWQIAQKIGISEGTLVVWLRDDPVRKDREQRIREAIKELTEERKEKE